MLSHRLDELVWMALTDPAFRERLLNGQRREIVDTFGLTEAERQAVLAVNADTLDDFAGALCQPGVLGV